MHMGGFPTFGFLVLNCNKREYLLLSAVKDCGLENALDRGNNADFSVVLHGHNWQQCGNLRTSLLKPLSKKRFRVK
jgi:hypothetical protein